MRASKAAKRKRHEIVSVMSAQKAFLSIDSLDSFPVSVGRPANFFKPMARIDGDGRRETGDGAWRRRQSEVTSLLLTGAGAV